MSLSLTRDISGRAVAAASALSRKPTFLSQAANRYRKKKNETRSAVAQAPRSYMVMYVLLDRPGPSIDLEASGEVEASMHEAVAA
jgi:hypothetical protein